MDSEEIQPQNELLDFNLTMPEFSSEPFLFEDEAGQVFTLSIGCVPLHTTLLGEFL